MTETELLDRMIEAERRAAIAESKLAVIEEARSKRNARSRACMRNKRQQATTSDNKRQHHPPDGPPEVSPTPLPNPPLSPPRATSLRSVAATSRRKAAGDGSAAEGYPWMGAVRSVLREVYGVEPKGKFWGRTLGPLVQDHGIELVCAELKAYCETTGAAYLNPVKFGELFGVWVADQRRGQEERAQTPIQRQMRASMKVAERMIAERGRNGDSPHD